MKILKNEIKIVGLFMALIGLSITFSSCSSMRGVSMEVLIPAQINVPNHIKKLAIANRSLPAKGQGLANILEGFLTGETIRGDRDASINCVNGLVSQLNNSPRFNAVIVSSPQLKGTGTREWPMLLNWAMVDSICKIYNTDALVTLEIFDSDIHISSYKKSHNEKDKDNKDIIVVDFFSDLKINVNAGWRIYDNIEKKVVDENSFIDEKGWNTKGHTPEEALKQLPDKRSALNTSGSFAGSQYGIRISPSWRSVYRDYFVKGKKEDRFKEAKQWAKNNNWSEAAKIWTNISTSSDFKNAGRAFYNLSVAAEMDGDLDKALMYAKKAGENYRVKQAYNYVAIIKQRIADQDRLKDQMAK